MVKKLIAHRGNTDGPKPNHENTLNHLVFALDNDFDVECDVRYENGEFYFGHDKIGEKCEIEFLKSSQVWTHAKTPETFERLSRSPDINAFYQELDGVAITTKGYFWVHSDHHISSAKSVHVVINYLDKNPKIIKSGYGICTDFPKLYKKLLDKNETKIFKLLILDIDGVMTNGKKTYDNGGTVISKEYCDRDFTAIKRFWSSDINVCFLSGDKKMNWEMSRSRGIPFFHARDFSDNLDKSKALEKICKHYNVAQTDVAYVGDDYYDLSIIEQLQWTYCPADACADIKKYVKEIIPCNGGDGVIASLFEMVKDKLKHTSFPYES